MSVYLGTFGRVELQREFDGGEITGTINSSDVNATGKRFSFDFDHGQLLSGDQIEISSTNGAALAFIDSYTNSSVKKFIHVDELDGIRLYNSFAHAVNGGTTNAVALAAISSNIPIRAKVANAERRLLASVNSYELNTERETVDTTTLSDEFRSRISTLMSGSGQMSAEWEYTGNTAEEVANYLLELQIRTQVGSQFKARFYLKTDAYNPSGVSANSNDSIWYEFSGVLTSCAVQFEVGSIVSIAANFITTGPIQIRMDLEVPEKLLQENADDILLEQGTNNTLMLESSA
jgi:hypothetical protein|tara:strand:+ start:78 stop:947 length:870 start_codon:yes stop_codon:yes gene_type:complete